VRRALTIGALCALLAPCAPARAVEREPDALLLARVCVSEAGFACWESGDGYAIHEAQLVGAERDGVSWRAYARAYSPRATGSRPTTDPRLAWVSALRLDERAPQGWPAPPHAPWSAYRSRWAYVLDRAREVVTWTLDDHDEWSMCSESPTDWAAPWHPPSPGLRRIDCGDAVVNAYYTRERAR
jgi:hypothetical protein